MGKLHINLLDTSFTIQSNENEEYLNKLLSYYTRIVEDVSHIESIQSPLQISILAGLMVCDELYSNKEDLLKIKNTNQLPPENNSDGEELERRTIAMIDKINKVL